MHLEITLRLSGHPNLLHLPPGLCANACNARTMIRPDAILYAELIHFEEIAQTFPHRHSFWSYNVQRATNIM